ncbi:MAG: aminotransferase class IV [Phycisphaerales bacterium]
MRVFLNDQFIDASEARISPFDRGFLLGDAVYEGLRAHDRGIVALTEHLNRMRQGLRDIRINFESHRLAQPTFDLLRENALDSAFVYWHVSRGRPAPGFHARARLPAAQIEPTVFGFATPIEPLSHEIPIQSASGALVEDCRWTRGDLKAATLLGSVLCAMEASDSGRDQAILHRDGRVTEGVSTNVLVHSRGRFVTPVAESGALLRGVTRDLLMGGDLGLVEDHVDIQMLREADEIMIVGTATLLVPITSLDGRPVGNGAVGPVATRARERLIDVSIARCEREEEWHGREDHRRDGGQHEHACGSIRPRRPDED